MRGSWTLREINDQPAAWAAALTRFEEDAARVDRLFEKWTPDEAIFTGCGSSYYLSMTAASAFQQITGLRARAVPASEIFQFPESVFARTASPLLVAASRSGTTTETLRAVNAATRRRVPTVCLTCVARSPLARSTDLALCSPAGGERSVVMTKSFSSMLVLGLLLAARRGDDAELHRELRRLPALGRRVLKIALPLARGIGTTASRFVFLGAGPAHGIAWEAMLKMTEMAQRTAMAYHPLEFRHGPIAVADRRTTAVLFGTDAGADMEADLVGDLSGHGATVLLLRDAASRPAEAEVSVSLNAGLSDASRSVLYLPFAQALAYWRAVGAELDPDRPRHLTSVVRL